MIEVGSLHKHYYTACYVTFKQFQFLLRTEMSGSAHQQVKCHARNIAVSTSPTEQCRRHFHIVVITHAVISILYFFMVLVLEEEQLWGSAILLAGVNQFTINMGGLLTVRMWIYT